MVAAGGRLRPRPGVDQVVLPAADLAQHRRGSDLARAGHLELAQDQLHRRRLVVGVVDGEARIDADGRAVAAQHAGAERVEGAHGHVPAALADEGEDARAHLGGGLVGERHGQDVPRLDALHADQVRDAVGQHARLARAGAGQDQQRPVGGADGACLLGIERATDARRGRLALLGVVPARRRGHRHGDPAIDC